VNPAVKDVTGYTFNEIKDRKFINWIHPEDEARMLKHWEELFAGKSYSEVEFRLVTKSGEIKWCSSSWGPLLDEQGKQIGVQGRERDISERKQLEKEVLESTTNERRRIGHDLHDGLGQYLAGIAFRAKALEQVLARKQSPDASEAGELATLISNAISQTRSLARGLDPIEVETVGLPAALQNLAADTRKFFEVNCSFRCSETIPVVEPQAALALYRIVQEAIHNAITHGGAGQIDIDLEGGHSLNLKIRDNGSGFTLGRKTNGGMGLRVMEYRAHSLGGKLTIDTREGRGTEVICTVPRSTNKPMDGAAVR
jgi:PAS domain S-box-containing protein